MYYPALSGEAAAAAADAARAWSDAAAAWRALATLGMSPAVPDTAERWSRWARACERAQIAGVRALMLAAAGPRWEMTPFGLTGLFAATPPKERSQDEAEPSGPALRRGFQALAKPLGRADNLTRIRGVGVKMQDKLNQLGVFHFWQIASLVDSEAGRLDAALGAGGRVMRDAWVAQAKRLAEDVPA
jgi:predicted flap endonuclease-1-like 5' DNA nuclease